MERYEPVKLLGEGSFGKVYLMRDKAQRKLLCVKSIKIKNIPKKERDATKMEVDLLRRLHHPNIVRYIDSFLTRDRDKLCIVMEYCDGGDLAAQIKAARRTMFSESKILHWFVQIALGVHYMHTNNVLHRDLKTQNIFMTGNGRLVLGDLGISKVLEGTMDFAKTCIGTPYYMSPEIFKNKPYSYKSDVWALGCVLYEMTTLNHAFDSTSINGLAQKIIKGKYPPIHSKYSRYLRELIGEMLMLEPRQRPNMDQILRKPVVKKHIINFFTDIASRPSSSIGEGTMIVRVAASSSSSSTAADNDVNMLAFRKQLKSLGLADELEAALQPRAAPTNTTEAKRAVKEVGAAVKREEDHKKMVEAALDKLRNERESRLRERNSMAANARARANNRAEEYERRKKEEAARAAAAMKPAAERRREARENRDGIPSASSASNSESEARQRAGDRVGRRRSFGEEINKDRERERRALEGRRKLQEQEERERAERLRREEEEKERARVEEKRREDFRQMAERADAKRQAEMRLREAKEEEAIKARKEVEEREEKARADKITAREKLRERERARQRDEIEQLKKDKLELDRRTRERDRIRESRRVEERRKLEENLRQKDHISPYQRDQLSQLDEKLSAPPSRRGYHHSPDDPVTSSSSPQQLRPNIVVAASARDKVLQKRQERQAKEEGERLKALEDAEIENRRARIVAANEGRAANGRPSNMGMEELAHALKDADGGMGSRYSSAAEAKSSSPSTVFAKETASAVSVAPTSIETDKKIRATARRRSFDNAHHDEDDDDYDAQDTDSGDDVDIDISPGGRLSESSDISMVSDSAGLDEDMKKREEELKEELKIATARCSQLKETLKETKSFFQNPGAAADAASGITSKGENDDGLEDVDSDTYDSDVDDSMEESWTAQSVAVGDIRDMKGKQLFEGKQADEGHDLDSTAPRAMKVQPALAVAIQPPVYRNLSDAPSPSGRLSDRIERLRQRCVEALGRGSFEDAYEFLKSHENDDRGMYEEDIEEEKQKKVRSILGEGKAHFMPLIEQLIFMEETHSS